MIPVQNYPCILQLHDCLLRLFYAILSKFDASLNFLEPLLEHLHFLFVPHSSGLAQSLFHQSLLNSMLPSVFEVAAKELNFNLNAKSVDLTSYILLH